MGKSWGLSDQKYGIALIGMTSELCETFTVRLDLMTGWFFFGRKKDFAKWSKMSKKICLNKRDCWRPLWDFDERMIFHNTESNFLKQESKSDTQSNYKQSKLCHYNIREEWRVQMFSKSRHCQRKSYAKNITDTNHDDGKNSFYCQSISGNAGLLWSHHKIDLQLQGP